MSESKYRVWDVTVPCTYNVTMRVIASSQDEAKRLVTQPEAVEIASAFVSLQQDKPMSATEAFPHDSDQTRIITCLQELADEAGADSDAPLALIVPRIAKRVYKETACGACFGCGAPWDRIIMSGYCEGTDAECLLHELRFPFPASAFWRTLNECDRDAIELWNQTHGCPFCWQGDGSDESTSIGGPVDPDCPACNGDGIIL